MRNPFTIKRGARAYRRCLSEGLEKNDLPRHDDLFHRSGRPQSEDLEVQTHIRKGDSPLSTDVCVSNHIWQWYSSCHTAHVYFPCKQCRFGRFYYILHSTRQCCIEAAGQASKKASFYAHHVIYHEGKRLYTRQCVRLHHRDNMHRIICASF
jgi:hypothetical protein